MLAINPVSLVSIIAWLKTKEPTEEYPFRSITGSCLFSCYLEERPRRPDVIRRR